MFELTIESEFCAAHAIILRGEREPVHGHNWHVTVTLAGPTLDQDGLLCDFHAAELALEAVIGPWKNADINTKPPFDTLNPSAENIAKTIAEQMRDRLQSVLPADARVAAVRVTEAPGCAATYRP